MILTRAFFRRLAVFLCVGLLCTTVMVGSSACVSSRSVSSSTQHSSSGRGAEWGQASTPAVGAVLLLHGLNNRPAVLRPWARFLQAHGYSTLLPALRGHAPGESLTGVVAEEWVEDVVSALKELQLRAPNEPHYVFCYSLGCAALLRTLQQPPLQPTQGEQLRGIVYFAPALQLTPFAELLRTLLPLRHLGVVVPSFVPPPLRVHAFTPVQAYAAVFSLVDRVWPTTVRGVAFVAEGDELVSVRGLKEWFGDELFVLKRAEVRRATPYAHLVVDPGALVPEAERRVKNRVLEFLRGSPRQN